MDFLAEDRDTLDRFLPGLDQQLASVPLTKLEVRDGPAVELFREAGGPGLLIPQELNGHGASASAAIRVQRAIGARSPSLAVATTMHHFSVASLIELQRGEQRLAWMLLQAIAEQRRLLASGFAEGVHSQGVFSPTMQARRVNGKVLISGSKKPCSLAHSMDILTASVALFADGADDRPTFAVALIPAKTPGISVSDFWGSSILAGAQSDAVTLTDVAVDPDLVLAMDGAAGVQTVSFLWFELLITASYLGMASALVERMLAIDRSEATTRAAIVADVESAMSSLFAVAQDIDAKKNINDRLLVHALLCRYAAQDAISRSVSSAVELLGGRSFIKDDEVSYFASASRALAFHPPQRIRASQAILDALEGSPLKLD
jgi:alkylation response protein AidB-like acyl-CoA dehydrogenase